MNYKLRKQEHFRTYMEKLPKGTITKVTTTVRN